MARRESRVTEGRAGRTVVGELTGRVRPSLAGGPSAVSFWVGLSELGDLGVGGEGEVREVLSRFSDTSGDGVGVVGEGRVQVVVRLATWSREVPSEGGGACRRAWRLERVDFGGFGEGGGVPSWSGVFWPNWRMARRRAPGVVSCWRLSVSVDRLGDGGEFGG